MLCFELQNCGTAHLKTHIFKLKWLPAFSVEHDWKMCTVTVLPSCLKTKDKHLMLFGCLATLLGLSSLSLSLSRVKEELAKSRFATQKAWSLYNKEKKVSWKLYVLLTYMYMYFS